MSRSNDEDFVATKDEQTFNDEGETIKVAEVVSPNKTKLNVIRQIGNKAGSKNFPTAKELLDSKQKPAEVIELKPKDK
jgi:hypothetical protein